MREILPHSVVMLDDTDRVALSVERGDQWVLKINSEMAYGPMLSIIMGENMVAKLRDFLSTFHTTKEDKEHADADMEKV